MELNKALEYSIILAWQDLARVMTPSVVRVEYESEQGSALDHVRVWLTTLKGNQYLVCEWSSTSGSAGTRFANGYSSARLADHLESIMKAQHQFTRGVDARRGLVLVYPADETKYFEAAAWAQEIPAAPPGVADLSAKKALSHVA